MTDKKIFLVFVSGTETEPFITYLNGNMVSSEPEEFNFKELTDSVEEKIMAEIVLETEDIQNTSKLEFMYKVFQKLREEVDKT